jgi:cob(I)alamin adenosyltransferase
MTPDDQMRRIDTLLSHVWMVRTFIKHSEEAEEDEELGEIHRTLYDCMLALGAPLAAGDAESYLRTLRKKISRLKQATQLFQDIQPEVSSHTNFQMAARSLSAAVEEIVRLLEDQQDTC